MSSGCRNDADFAAVPRECLVDRVVDHLVDEMVKPPRPGRANVHTGPLADRFQALEDGDVLGAVGVVFFAAAPSALSFLSGNWSFPRLTENPDRLALSARLVGAKIELT